MLCPRLSIKSSLSDLDSFARPQWLNRSPKYVTMTTAVRFRSWRERLPMTLTKSFGQRSAALLLRISTSSNYVLNIAYCTVLHVIELAGWRLLRTTTLGQFHTPEPLCPDHSRLTLTRSVREMKTRPEMSVVDIDVGD